MTGKYEQAQFGFKVGGLFAGIGGLEQGLSAAGHHTVLLCESDPAAIAVLERRFPRISVSQDVRELVALDDVGVVAAGFPCQDLSQAGRTAGIHGERSGLVDYALDLAARQPDLEWLLLENVPFMLALDRGAAMHWLARRLDAMGLIWAYRVVDTRSFGIPQRRRRVILLASATNDPRAALLNQDDGPPTALRRYAHLSRGFYWTEGNTGLGLVTGATPPLKSGSALGIPSPPAIWKPRDGRIAIPDIRDAERLQGFDLNWTIAADEMADSRRGARWRLVGNAVSVPVSAWVGDRLLVDEPYDANDDTELGDGDRWPDAAWGRAGRRWAVPRSAWPVRLPMTYLDDFLQFPTHDLSERATRGFYTRIKRSTLRVPRQFLRDTHRHIETMTQLAADLTNGAAAASPSRSRA